MELDAALELSGRAKKILESQIDLRETTEEAPEEKFDRLAGEQDAIHAEAKVMTSLAFVPQIENAFRLAGDEMVAAIEALKIPARGPAVEHQQNAEVALQEGLQSLDTFISGLILATENSDEDPMVTAFLDGIQELVLRFRRNSFGWTSRVSPFACGNPRLSHPPKEKGDNTDLAFETKAAETKHFLLTAYLSHYRK